MKKILVLFLVMATIFVAGCADTPKNSTPENNIEVQEIVSDIPEETVAQTEIIEESPTEQEVIGEPELMIPAVTSDNNILNIKVSNVGTATAQNVYCGVIAFGASNTIAYDMYMTNDDFHVMANAVRGGLTGETFTYETNYKYEDTPNMTLTYKLAGIDFLGNIQPGETVVGTTEVVYGTSRSSFLKLAWIDGEEDKFVIY